MPYNSRKGAYKLVASSATETFYGSVAVINNSGQDIHENFLFPTLDGFKIEGLPAGSKEVGLNVPAGAMDIILLKRHGERRANFQFKAQMSGRPLPNKCVFQDKAPIMKASPQKQPARRITPPDQNAKRVHFEKEPAVVTK